MDIGLKTDIHSHILPAVDDGSRSTSSSISILNSLYESGVRRFTLTPHVSGGLFPNTETSLRLAFDALSKTISEELPSDIELHLGAEYMLDEFFEDIQAPLTYPDKSILIEMSYQSRSSNLMDSVFRLVQDGYHPVLAHPERYEFYFTGRKKVRTLPEIEKLIDMGCRLQLNIQSLTGCYGQGSFENLKYMLDHDMYSFIATDIHSASQMSCYKDFKVSSGQFEKVRQLAVSNDTLFLNK